MSERVADPPSPYAGCVSYSDYSRLAARVAELEGEKERLRARLIGMACHAEHFSGHMAVYADCQKCVLAQKEIDEVLS